MAQLARALGVEQHVRIATPTASALQHSGDQRHVRTAIHSLASRSIGGGLARPPENTAHSSHATLGDLAAHGATWPMTP